MIYHLLYISEKSETFDEASDLDSILETSIANNRSSGLSGILISNDKYFIQLIEGNETKVKNLFSKIKLDKRHQRVKELLSFKDFERIFPDWKMGHFYSQKLPKGLSELISLIHQGYDLNNDQREKSLKLLSNFSRAG